MTKTIRIIHYISCAIIIVLFLIISFLLCTAWHYQGEKRAMVNESISDSIYDTTRQDRVKEYINIAETNKIKAMKIFKVIPIPVLISLSTGIYGSIRKRKVRVRQETVRETGDGSLSCK